MKQNTIMTIDFADAFKTDLIETYGYSKAEAEIILHQKGKDFIEEMLDDMWLNWSENFPVEMEDS